jgi:exodeoxyribonuclease VII large subunit
MELPARDILTPTQLNTLARDLLEGSFPAIWVEAELGNVTRPASGHLYFTLKDARAQIRCAMFKPKSTWLKFAPREGVRVLARGRVTLYEARGEYQLVLDHMEEAGEGALRRAFEQLRARLQAEGLFDPERKRPLPAFPQRLAVITSPSGAAVRDVISVLGRRFPLLDVDLLPTQVQGTTAATQIAALVRKAGDSGRYDAVLVTRGGGSIEDLWAFNEEVLVRAIADCAVPVVSAVGHETDFTLSDFAADLRAPTPSAAAELLVPSQVDLGTRLRGLGRRLHQLQTHQLDRAMQRSDRAWLRLQGQSPQARLQLMRRRHEDALRRLQAQSLQLLDARSARLRHAMGVLRAHSPQRRLAVLAERLTALQPRPQAAVVRQLQRDALRLRGLVRSLEAVSPLATVSRGYALVSKEDGTLVRSTTQVANGDRLHARLSDGQLTVQVLASPEA